MAVKNKGKVIIFSAPSGSGKSTIVNVLLQKFPRLEFSISATSRAPRGEEQDGREYYFLSGEEFLHRVEQGHFVEWEEVYVGTCYGTLRSEIERIWAKGNVIVFDIDVKGGIRLKEKFGADALAVFIMPPSIEELEKRLRKRGTDAEDTIKKRIARAGLELGYAEKFDKIIVNDSLEKAINETERAISEFLHKSGN
jgi:guanylate kinase